MRFEADARSSWPLGIPPDDIGQPIALEANLQDTPTRRISKTFEAMDLSQADAGKSWTSCG